MRRVATPAGAADRALLAGLLHGKETRVRGDQADRGPRAVIRRWRQRAVPRDHRLTGLMSLTLN